MDPSIEAIVRGGLALLWLSAAAHKLRDLASFRTALAEYRLLPAGVTGAAAVALVAAETGAGLALLATPILTGGLVASVLLLALYAGAIAVNLLRGRRHIDCGCAGPARRRPVSAWLVARNLGVAAVALMALAPPHPRTLTWIDALTIPAGVLAAAILYTATDHLLALPPAAARSAG